MSRVKKFIVADEYRDEVLELLKSKGVKARAIGPIVYERVPKSLVRLSDYFTYDEMEKYLVPFVEDNREQQIDMSEFGI
jgi:hypothetical protein